MEQAAKTFTSDGADVRKWIGRILAAVIMGEAIWGLIVSVMNNLVVPWLGDVLGQSSGVPTSFTQRPYNYPDLFVSVVEFCIAGLVAAVLNYFFQRPTGARVKGGKIPKAPVEPARVVPQVEAVAAPIAAARIEPATPPIASPVAPVPVAKAEPAVQSAPVRVAPPAPPPPAPPAPVAKPLVVAPPAPPVASSAPAKPLPPPPKVQPAKPQKPKEVYYNIVGEPMPSDDD